MILTLPQANLRKPTAIETAIAEHGAWNVLFAAAAALLRGRMRKARPPDMQGLSPWMRADIGLPPSAPLGPDWRLMAPHVAHRL